MTGRDRLFTPKSTEGGRVSAMCTHPPEPSVSRVAVVLVVQCGARRRRGGGPRVPGSQRFAQPRTVRLAGACWRHDRFQSCALGWLPNAHLVSLCRTSRVELLFGVLGGPSISRNSCAELCCAARTLGASRSHAVHRTQAADAGMTGGHIIGSWDSRRSPLPVRVCGKPNAN